jgi:uncharacterized protein YxeA
MTYLSIFIVLKIFIISLFILEIKSDGDASLRNIHVQKKLQQKLKQEKHSKDIKSCENIDDWNPLTKSVYFLLTSLNHDYKNDDLSSINAFSPFLDSCTNQSELIEIEWKYQYFESMHCIKIELDLKNSTNFIEKAKYNYYSFSYRELGKRNKFRPRQIINESVNSLVVKNVNLRPYIICVTFYKGDYLSLSQETPNISTHQSNISEIGCKDYTILFSQDKQTHDVDLCVDIDTQAHFLTDISNHGYSNAELIMVCFIVVILIALLILITITHSLTQKPKIKRFREYLNHRLHLHASAHKGSDEKHIHTAGNCSSAHSLHSNEGNNNYNHHGNNSELKDDNHISETTSLLVPGSNNILNHRNDSKSSAVRFHLAEIVEDEEAEVNKDDLCNNENEAECIKSIAHLLDDKPWSSSRSNSIAHMKDNNPC